LPTLLCFVFEQLVLVFSYPGPAYMLPTTMKIYKPAENKRVKAPEKDTEGDTSALPQQALINPYADNPSPVPADSSPKKRSYTETVKASKPSFHVDSKLANKVGGQIKALNRTEWMKDSVVGVG